jgi:hypothetical protein
MITIDQRPQSSGEVSQGRHRDDAPASRPSRDFGAAVNASRSGEVEPFHPTLDNTFESRLLARIEAARYPMDQPIDD